MNARHARPSACVRRETAEKLDEEMDGFMERLAFGPLQDQIRNTALLSERPAIVRKSETAMSEVREVERAAPLMIVAANTAACADREDVEARADDVGACLLRSQYASMPASGVDLRPVLIATVRRGHPPPNPTTSRPCRHRHAQIQRPAPRRKERGLFDANGPARPFHLGSPWRGVPSHGETHRPRCCLSSPRARVPPSP